MKRRIEARLHFVREFSNNVAHEFRTPLSTVVGAVELMQDHPGMTEAERREFLDSAAQQLGRMSVLIDGLLSLGRHESLGDAAEVRLDELLKDELRRAQVPFAGEAASVRGDEAALRLVVQNLVQNAFRHGSPPVHVRAWREPTRAGFDVVDHGGGVPEDVRDKIFDRFFTTDRTNGLGLGLPLVQTIVHAHGGDVALATEDGVTTFRVSFPLTA